MILYIHPKLTYRDGNQLIAWAHTRTHRTGTHNDRHDRNTHWSCLDRRRRSLIDKEWNDSGKIFGWAMKPSPTMQVESGTAEKMLLVSDRCETVKDEGVLAEQRLLQAIVICLVTLIVGLVSCTTKSLPLSWIVWLLRNAEVCSFYPSNTAHWLLLRTDTAWLAAHVGLTFQRCSYCVEMLCACTHLQISRVCQAETQTNIFTSGCSVSDQTVFLFSSFCLSCCTCAICIHNIISLARDLHLRCGKRDVL